MGSQEGGAGSLLQEVLWFHVSYSLKNRVDQGNIDMTTKSSPVRLIPWGRARLVRLTRSHQAAIRGRIVCGP